MSSKKITFAEDANIQKKNSKTTTKSHSHKYREFDELRIYSNISKIDKNQYSKYKNPQKWYLKKRKEALEIIQTFSKKYEFSKHTLYAAIQFSDRVLGFINEINQKDFDLTVIACCLMASKFVENDAFDIDLNEVISLSKNNKISAEEIYKSEINVCKILNYFLEIPNVYEFIQYLNLIGVFYQGEIKNPKAVSDDIQDFTRKIMFSDIALKYPNEVIGMCIIRTVRKKYKLNEDTMKKIIAKYKFNYDKIYEDCYDDILFLIFGEKRDRKLEEEKEKKEKEKKEKEKEKKEKEKEKEEKKEDKKSDKKTEKKKSNLKLTAVKENEIENKENNKNERNQEKNLNAKISENRNSNQQGTMRRGRGSIVIDIPKDQNLLNLNNSSSSSSSSNNFSFSSDSEDEKEEEIKKKNTNEKIKKKNSVHFHEDKNEYFGGRSTHVKLKTIIGHKEKQRHIKALHADKINFPFAGEDGNKKETDSPNQNRMNNRNNNRNPDLKKFNSSKEIKIANKNKINSEKKESSKSKSAKKSKEKNGSNKSKSTVNFPKVEKKEDENNFKNK